MAILRNIILLLPTIFLTGCYENFTPEVDTKPVLCLNSLIVAGNPIEVEVSHTWKFNDEKAGNDHSVDDARVSIFANGEPVGENYLPKEGDRIRITAESATYGTATAEVEVPHATPIGKVSASAAVTDLWRGDEDFFKYEMIATVTFNLNIEMSVDDPADTDNYYLFDYNWVSPPTDHPDESDDAPWIDYTPVFSIGQFEYNAEPIFKEHIGFFETVTGNADDTYFSFFSDRQFAGKTYPLHLNFSGNIFRVKSQKYDETLLEGAVNLYLSTVSQSYYNWAVYKWNADAGITGDLADLGMAESKWGYSNVSTGAGVVAAKSSACFTVNLKDFLESVLPKP